MLFNSFHFLVFFLFVTILYYSLPFKYRWMLLLISSCYFYMVFIPVYILILGFTIVVDYFAGILIEKAEGGKRKLFLIFSLVANIGVLAVFKYYNFLNENLNVLLHTGDLSTPFPVLSILLPVGLSFHTFQAMSYTIEVYRGRQGAERNFGIYALYVMFFPQLVAGPIERPQNLLPQFRLKHEFDYERVVSGLRTMGWGLFKKVVIADRLAMAVDYVYDKPQEFQGLSLIIATLFFAFQIFCDFSGYSDMAIGAAQVLGIRLMKNFDRPYHAKNFNEFWKRWHISLSSWFKDYLYISLGGNRVSIPRWYLNLMIVFLISGLWHGANWTFVIWGALHGFYLVFALLTRKPRIWMAQAIGLSRFPGLQTALKILTTFSLTCFAWIFFRANSLADAFYIIRSSFTGLFADVQAIRHAEHINLIPGLTKTQLLTVLAAILLMEAVHLFQYRVSLNSWITRRPAYVRWSIYYAALFIIFFFGVFENRQFIYFQF
ncbi:MAG: MBOAT family O-acyltransferase [Bacteroidales bacterium]